MKGFLFIDDIKLGEVDLQIIDESMGVIGGHLSPHPEYYKYKNKIQDLYESKGIANSDDFNFKLLLENNMVIDAVGGIGITHSRMFDDEIDVDICGVHSDTLSMIS